MKIKAIKAAESNAYCLALNTEPGISPAFLERVRVSWANDDVLKQYIPFVTPDGLLKLHSNTFISLNVSSKLIPSLEKALTEGESASAKPKEEKSDTRTLEILREVSGMLGIPIE